MSSTTSIIPTLPSVSGSSSSSAKAPSSTASARKSASISLDNGSSRKSEIMSRTISKNSQSRTQPTSKSITKGRSGNIIDSASMPSQEPTIVASSSSSSSNAAPAEVTSTSSASSSSYSYYHISIIVIVLLFVGVNIFYYLGAITEYLRDLFSPLLSSIMNTLGYTASNTATGAKTGIDVASGTVESGLDVLQGQLSTVEATTQHDGTGISTSTAKKSNSVSADDDSGLTSALNHAAISATEDNASMYLSRNGEANFTGKSGYCYVGEDRGFRSCVSVSPDDTCMSGDIFPTMDICVNPSLRE